MKYLLHALTLALPFYLIWNGIPDKCFQNSELVHVSHSLSKSKSNIHGYNYKVLIKIYFFFFGFHLRKMFSIFRIPNLVIIISFSFSCPVDLARTFSKMLNCCVENRHPCLVPDLKYKMFDLSSLNVLLTEFFHG